MLEGRSFSREFPVRRGASSFPYNLTIWIFSGSAFVSCVIPFMLIGVISFSYKYVFSYLPWLRKGCSYCHITGWNFLLNHFKWSSVFKATEYHKINILLTFNTSTRGLAFWSYFWKINWVLSEVASSFRLQFIVFLPSSNKNIYSFQPRGCPGDAECGVLWGDISCYNALDMAYALIN